MTVLHKYFVLKTPCPKGKNCRMNLAAIERKSLTKKV